MIVDLDLTLRRLLTTSVPGITVDAQVGFQPPDEDWRTYVKNLQVGGASVNALNVYLVDLREHRKLRTNERARSVVNGGDVLESPGARRVDCHYLISAWSPADVTPALEPTLDEHALLYSVIDALCAHDPLVPAEVFAPAPPPLLLAKQELPVVVLPAEGFMKIAEFWGTMGDKHRWKPSIYVVVTLPVLPRTFLMGPAVTTLLAAAGASEVMDMETQAVIGGTVRTGAPAVPVPDAWVELLMPPPLGIRLRLVRTDADGRFRFASLGLRKYSLRASSATLGPSPLRTIDVPSPTGEYDLTL